MLHLATILLKEKFRKLRAQYGWVGCASFGVMLALLASAAGISAARLLRAAAHPQVASVMNTLWWAWVMAGLFLGKDLTWQIGLQRLKLFPIPGFGRLWLFGLLLSFVSFPILLVVIIFEVVGAAAGLSISSLIAILIGSVLLAASAHLTVSLARSAVHQRAALSKIQNVALTIFFFGILGWLVAALSRPAYAAPLPGAQFSRVLLGQEASGSLSAMATAVLLLGIADLVVQRRVTCSGIAGPAAGGAWLGSVGGLLLAHPAWPSPLWRISLLGWLRNYNALLLLLWGSLYGFFFMYFSRPEEAFDFVLFGGMVLVFHSYLRGNLLGVDHRGVWLYYLFPVPVEKALRAKNQTLSVVQGAMVAAVFAPVLLHPVSGMDVPSWLRVISNAYCTIVMGEIWGSVFSLYWPEPIERSSHFSGGLSTGGLVVPLLQALFSLVFLSITGLTRRFLPPWAFQMELIAVPAALWLVKSRILRAWNQRFMVDERKNILARLSVFSS